MTTTSQQPPAEDPSQGPGSHDRGVSGGGRSAGVAGARRSSLWLVMVIAVVVIVVALLGWLFTVGPLSESTKQERAIQSTLEDMGGSTSFAEFNGFLCAEQRVPQDLVDTITTSGEQTGTDLDAMFRESIAGSLPEDLKVIEVEVNGENAVATVESGAGDEQSETVQMRQEDDAWTVCESGVGMGSVPASAPSEQPG